MNEVMNAGLMQAAPVQGVHGELSRLNSEYPGETIPWNGNDVLTISMQEYERAVETLLHLKDVFALPQDLEHIHWQSVNRNSFSPDFVTRVNHTLVNVSNLGPFFFQPGLEPEK